ncbi:MAG TPA: thiamine diphosphokinase [Clostridiaceae bacterium]|nr:thiamine diphosphokinase [Clostridiaceae bacterium]
MKVLIVGNGNLSDTGLLIKKYEWADLVIAADGGARYLNESGLAPHVMLGDFDSLPEPVLRKFGQDGKIEIVAFEPEKDYTDMELAIDLALERGASEIAILGASGTRLDHTVSNIHLLYKILKNGAKGHMEDEKNRIFLIDRFITLNREDSRKVSLLPLPPHVKGVTTTGLSYPLSDETLFFGTGRGISNEFCADNATVTIKEGLLLIFVSKD